MNVPLGAPLRAILALLAACVFVAPPSYATRDLSNLSLEELMNEPVTSVAKRETRLGDSAAAVTVVTAEDLRRFGITTLADALRLAPGMEVARINSTDWAVSVRGFLGPFADKLLVMIDGRTIYEPMFAGVQWGIQDVVFEDVERIEVIRGPGATLWGANAVNGVVNIITKNAADTHGTLLSTSVGSEERPSMTLRHGGQTESDVDYRAYLKYFDRKGLLTSNGGDAGDDWSALRTGFRLDWQQTQTDTYTLTGDMFSSRVTENVTNSFLTPPYATTFRTTDDQLGGHVLGRWSRTISDTSQLTVQSFYNRSQFRSAGDKISADTFDLDVQHQWQLAARHNVIWGMGYRLIADDAGAGRHKTLAPTHRIMHLYTSFVHDEVTLIPERLRFTMGFKFEHNYQTGFEVQPGISLAWTPYSNQTLWAAISRAVRTPDRFELSGRRDLVVFSTDPETPPTQVSILGEPDLHAEELLSYELGYRFEPAPRVSLDVTTYYSDYGQFIDFSRTTVAFQTTPTPHLQVSRHADNNPGGTSYGAEASLGWKVTDHLRVSADYNWLHLNFLKNNSESNSPDHQAHLRMYLTLPQSMELSGALSYTDQLSGFKIDAYLRLDMGLIWRAGDSVELGLWGTNLLDERHAEFKDLQTATRTEVPRGAVFKITKRF